MGTKVWASPEGIKEINRKREDKGWTKDQNSEVLIIASQEQFKKSIKKYLSITEDKKNIPIEELEDLLNKQKIFTQDQQMRKRISHLRSQKIKEITFDECLRVIEQKDIHTPGITYRNWQKFLRGKENDSIDIKDFEAFCEALEIPDWRKFVIYPPIYQKTATNQTRLVEGLSLFNHQKQVELLMERFPKPTQIFLINNPCSYSRTWMVRRLAAKITEYNPRQCRPVALNNSNYSSSSKNHEKKDINNLFHKKEWINIASFLDSAHLIFTLNVDDYDFQRLNTYLQQYWIPLVDYLKRIQQKKQGKIFMFLLASAQKNHWGKPEAIRTNLAPEIINLHQTTIYTENELNQELVKVLQDIAARLDDPLSDDSTKIAADLIKKIEHEQNKAENLLKVIYQHFNCQTTEFASIWQTYP
ncbi:hypothetical protein G7B40_029980 [Aetokthonos hydrillicola Thurmond2011]|jgi:hypothetical protein|uniref:Inactive STAND domain-containing protein n=1 Tax=Aetokthonos hydrillicola Thurmond2011 TaxID=2712845 RepID=A0AAP5MC47_9CYAN|nr:hypothetical protein [Aetokthonos hydrillicola]MBO3463761.1 hypothetical protein [Aetokthonos hydrillicola CCALA 1050]MBW4589197.1 hypothetical protein [Aetokthonos hydrillicola CCALA 1050]MDR9898757.1 hypothetical protein [Aetokthonos hydrillicola Thurmond2011]